MRVVTAEDVKKDDLLDFNHIRDAVEGQLGIESEVVSVRVLSVDMSNVKLTDDSDDEWVSVELDHMGRILVPAGERLYKR